MEKIPPDKLYITFADVTPDFHDAVDVIVEKNNKELLKWFINNFDTYNRIYNFVTQIEESSTIYILYQNIFIYTIYFTCWCYILYEYIYSCKLIK